MFNNERALIPVFITATLLTVIFIFFLFATLIRLKNKKTKKEHDTLKAINEERERTMNTISIEIHNNVNQVLSLALTTMSMIRRYAVPGQEKYIADSEKMLQEAMCDLRSISHSLNADHLKRHGLQESLDKECRRLNNTRKINCHLDVEGIPMSFKGETELILIRIAQEAIQNVLKHAYAQNLEIILDYRESQFRMTIRDNGKGFDPVDAHNRDGMGLQSIRNQSRIIDGCTIDLLSAPGKGTALTLSIRHPQYLEIKKIGDAPFLS
ncbi:MAG TPA: ATP-binding protein [Edaphocola sp.]|nr:ATP-binding protein [Edaphocola sp.]